jgi:hypothetical protein
MTDCECVVGDETTVVVLSTQSFYSFADRVKR